MDIILYGNKIFNLENPDPSCIDSDSICKTLANICRFTGRVNRFYSVAEHTLLTFDLATRKGYGLNMQRHMLLHDAAEAFLGDMISPVKKLCPQFMEVEEKVTNVIYKKFGVELPTPQEAQLVKEIDKLALYIEVSHNFVGNFSKETWSIDNTHMKDIVENSDLFTNKTIDEAAFNLRKLYFLHFDTGM